MFLFALEPCMETSALNITYSQEKLFFLVRLMLFKKVSF